MNNVLSDLLPRLEPSAVIATDQGRNITADEFLKRVASWYRLLEEYSESHWILFNKDPVEFAAQLLALWQSGKTACLPGDDLPATQERMSEITSRALGEWPGALSAPLDDVAIPEWNTLSGDHPAVEILTSGSSGEPKLIAKQLCQLSAEVENLMRVWPVVQADTVVLSTVSHQHIYGLLFRVLWPLCGGFAMECRLDHFIEDLRHSAELYPRRILISSPSHLSRLPAMNSHSAMADGWTYIFSSAAPLARADSLNARHVLGNDIYEVYGSSETGGIGWRAQHPEGESVWQLMPGHRLSIDPSSRGILESDYVQHRKPWLLDDYVELLEHGKFRLQGRVDRIVKLEGKRVSLSAMEKALLERPEISRASVLVIQRHRQESVAVVELSSVGLQQQAQLGYRALQQIFKTCLADRFESVTLPRRWRLLETWPVNQQGKTPLQMLAALFDKSEDEAPKWPRECHCEWLSSNAVSLELEIPENLLYFDGHFDDVPVLSGVVMVHWAAHLGNDKLPIKGSFIALEAIKFQKVVTGLSSFSLHLEYHPENGKLHFSYQSEQGVHARGRICFG